MAGELVTASGTVLVVAEAVIDDGQNNGGSEKPSKEVKGTDQFLKTNETINSLTVYGVLLLVASLIFRRKKR